MESVFSSLRDPWARKWLFFALALNLVAAYFSWGFHQFDEQFQILEFASYKLGNSPATDLPWEFDTQIRQWFQPAFAVMLAKLFGDPFELVLVFRFISALLGWLSTVVIASCCAAWFKDEKLRRWAILGSCFLWFFPYLHARPSSEGWSASLFFLGFIPVVMRVLQHRSKGDDTRLRLPAWEALLYGALLGLAFECRYQVGIMIAAGGLWTLKYGRLEWQGIAFLGTGLLAAILLGTGLDAWGYGELTLAPWNYIDLNLIQNRAADYGVSPWWDYFPQILTKGLPPLSLVLLTAVMLSWVLERQSSLTWVTLSFFLVHVLIGHKEFRFLFPILPAVPVQAVMAVQALKKRGILWKPASEPGKFALRAFFGMLMAVNFAALAVLTVLPPRLEVLVFRRIHANAPQTLITEGPDPFVMARLPINYYRHPGTEIRLSPDPADPSRREMHWLLRQGPEAPAAPVECRLEFSTLPEMLIGSPIHEPLRQARALEWSLYSCPSTGEH
jgi:phosphatidylinositol glycan class B